MKFKTNNRWPIGLETYQGLWTRITFIRYIHWSCLRTQSQPANVIPAVLCKGFFHHRQTPVASVLCKFKCCFQFSAEFENIRTPLFSDNHRWDRRQFYVRDCSDPSAIVAIIWNRLLFSYRSDSSDPCYGKFTSLHYVLYALQDGTNIVAYFMEEVLQYGCLYNRLSRDYKNKYMNVDCCTATGEKFDMSACRKCR